MHVQPHFYRLRQVEPCHQLGWSNQALTLSILALGAMPKQHNNRPGQHVLKDLDDAVPECSPNKVEVQGSSPGCGDHSIEGLLIVPNI